MLALKKPFAETETEQQISDSLKVYSVIADIYSLHLLGRYSNKNLNYIDKKWKHLIFSHFLKVICKDIQCKSHTVYMHAIGFIYAQHGYDTSMNTVQ